MLSLSFSSCELLRESIISLCLSAAGSRREKAHTLSLGLLGASNLLVIRRLLMHQMPEGHDRAASASYRKYSHSAAPALLLLNNVSV
jgi:hypothetical protein